MLSFKNGREAKELDAVIASIGTPPRVIAGVLQITPAPNTSGTGIIHVQEQEGAMGHTVPVAGCVHAEDALTAFNAAQPTPKAESAAPETTVQ